MIFSPSIYTQDQIEKLGNAVIFLCERIKPLTKTKLLKLIYLIEESSVKKFGIPFFNIRFDAWRLGPVARDLYVELTEETALLERFIEKTTKNDIVNIVAKKSFSDDQFSDNEVALLEQIVQKFKYSSADDLIELTHREHSPWHVTAEENGLLVAFENRTATASNVEIDLSKILAGDEEKLKRYKNHQDFITETRSLKR